MGWQPWHCGQAYFTWLFTSSQSIGDTMAFKYCPNCGCNHKSASLENCVREDDPCTNCGENIYQGKEEMAIAIADLLDRVRTLEELAAYGDGS